MPNPRLCRLNPNFLGNLPRFSSAQVEASDRLSPSSSRAAMAAFEGLGGVGPDKTVFEAVSTSRSRLEYRSQRLRNALQVDGDAPELECLLVVTTRSQGVIKAHGELDRRLVP